MSTRSPRAARLASALCALVACCALASCDKARSYTGATPVHAAKMVLDGAASFASPGDVARLTATVTYPDQSTRDVTAAARWSTQSRAVQVTAPGVLTATGYGTDMLTVIFDTTRVTLPLRVAPAGAFLLTGSVYSEGGTALSDVRLAIMSRLGTVTGATDGTGSFTLPALGDTTVRVETEGFDVLTQQLAIDLDRSASFYLHRIPVAGNLSGQYRLTISASPSCALPDYVMRREYDASVDDVRGQLRVVVSGADLVAWGGDSGFTGVRDGTNVRFEIRATFDDGLNLIERVDDSHDLMFSGTAEGTVDGPSLAARFNGFIALQAFNGTGPQCQASDHGLVLARSAGR